MEDMRLSTALRSIGGELEYYRVNEQDDIAAYEVKTPGYDMLNLTVSYSLDSNSRYSMYLRGSNLLDEEVWNHASFLANVVPLPGRSLSAGVKMSF